MPLIYIRDEQQFFWYAQNEADRAPYLATLVGEATSVHMRMRASWSPTQTEDDLSVEGLGYPLRSVFWHLLRAESAVAHDFDDALRVWHSCCRLVLDLLVRGRAFPSMDDGVRPGEVKSAWQAALDHPADATALGALAKATPAAVVAAGVSRTPRYDDADHQCADATKLLYGFCNDAMDMLVRHMLADRATPEMAFVQTGARPKANAYWELQWHRALHRLDPTFSVSASQTQKLLRVVQPWGNPQKGQAGKWCLCLRVSAPASRHEPFMARLSLRSPVDPNNHLPLNKLSEAILSRQTAYTYNTDMLNALLLPAQDIFEPLRRYKKTRAFALKINEVEYLLHGGARALRQAGYAVVLPDELVGLGSTDLHLRLHVGGQATHGSDGVPGENAINMAQIVQCSWEALLGDQPVTAAELEALAEQAASLVEYRGRWLSVDQDVLSGMHRRLQHAPCAMSMQKAFRAVLSGEVQDSDLLVQAVAAGPVLRAIEDHRHLMNKDVAAPPGLRAVLRPYQRRGLAWLDAMSRIGLGACLADDMGLGKTVQMLSVLLLHRQRTPDDLRPDLLVAPTSVLSNWANQAAAFAPDLRVRQHYGIARSRDPAVVGANDGAIVLTSYGTLRQDADMLTDVMWHTVVLDEAQHIKNAASGVARAAHRLTAQHRFALTGTPLENRLQELWSILHFANPGILGSQAYFRRSFSGPIEKQQCPEASARLRRVVRPFMLRRLKTDPGVAQDLPPKLEMDVCCRLTQEQAVLYRAAVDKHLKDIAESEGFARRGRIFSLLTHLKQICNHPAHYLKQEGPLPHRSGKLLRLTEILAEVLAEDDGALIFTQYKEMGTLLVRHIEQVLGVEPMFLHGGTPRTQRDAFVDAFQKAEGKPGVFVLSLKAGGTGLTLTAASHVFHYDRWWNPAVEDQATDRAHRIGQRRCLQVHKLICTGTVEEKLDQILKQKRTLSKTFVGSSEDWISDLDDDDLGDLFSLSAQTNDWLDSDSTSDEHTFSA